MIWKPIETAPKDKTILLYIPAIGCSVGAWERDEYALKPRPFWNCDRSANRRICMRNNQPTHWTELPEAPGGSK